MSRGSLYGPTYFSREYFSMHAGKQAYLRFLVDQVDRLDPPAGRWFDVGSGLGFFVAESRAIGRSAIGVEHALAAAFSREQCARPALVAADVEAGLPLADASCAAVCLWDVIEHLAQAEAALADCFRVLVPGGVVLVLTLNAASLARPLLGRSWSYHLDPTHVRLYSSRRLRRELEASGFAGVRIWTWMNFLSVGEGSARLRPLRRIGRVVQWPWFGDSLLATARRPVVVPES